MTKHPKKTKSPKKNVKNKGKDKNKKPKTKVKRVYQVGIFTILFMIMLTSALFLFTPLYAVMLSLVPKSYQQIITKKLHQNIILYISNNEFSKPLKHVPKEPLPVLSERSGICFYFRIKNDDDKMSDMINSAKKGKHIAEIIVIDDHKTEYNLKFTTTYEIMEDGYNATVICQIFGKDHPVPPDIVNIIYIRPIVPFTTYKTMWITKKTIYVDKNQALLK